MHGKSFTNFANSVIVAKLFCWYILHSTGINSALLESRNFSIGMQSSVIRETFPVRNFPRLQYNEIRNKHITEVILLSNVT